MFCCYNYYTKIFSNLFLISCVVPLTIQLKNYCERLDLEFTLTSYFFINHNIGSW